ncbi:hypothetical protein PMG11_07063 [Penicillium brasilianum]|uniref:Zn(2)-C6 fungal-type domain-containing protein n=1 Tax=Penicillium brasilianum TaxID=104259 RepID=A0A0F7TTL1_PENBI|nr:hypothetical protein PMG11_07063 [Penicillium brasilianum]
MTSPTSIEKGNEHIAIEIDRGYSSSEKLVCLLHLTLLVCILSNPLKKQILSLCHSTEFLRAKRALPGSIHYSVIAMPSPDSSLMPLRVCDRCIRKKVRCNQARPTCSRCFELGETCSYTSVKRKPGPSIGSHYGSNSSKSRRSSAYKRRNSPSREAPRKDLSSDEAAPASEGHILQDPLGFSPPVTTANQTPTNVSHIASQIIFTPEQAEYLLESYFDILQDANPIFSKELFLHRYRSCQCSEDLISTILIMTAKLTGFTVNEDDPIILDTCLDQILSSSILEDDLIGDILSLDQFRKAFILAFYEFHQFPGHQAWLRVGRVTRMAYRIGLDRLDHIRTLYPDWNTVSPEDIQEWKSLWWCLYRLDTYSNISSGTPYLVDDSVICTSLIQSHAVQPSGASNNSSELFLQPKSEDLSKVLLAASSSPETLLMNVHNITTAILRQAGLVFRLNLPRSQEAIGAQVAKVERQLATIRLALPPGWLNPRRNAFSDESHADHHARTITVLHLRMAQLLLSIADTGLRQGDEWLLSWQNVLETSQDIASIADQWDSSFCLAVDPAISFTIFTAMIFLDLHKKATIMAEHNHSSDIDHHITVLHLQLQHFARIWTLPRLLKLSFESFSQSVSGPLSHRHITLILSRFEAPLHPRWLQFLSSANTVLADCQ